MARRSESSTPNAPDPDRGRPNRPIPDHPSPTRPNPIRPTPTAPARLDTWPDRLVEAAGIAAALLGAVALALDLAGAVGARSLLVDGGVSTLLAAGGVSYVLRRRAAWYHVVAARLIAVLGAVVAVVVLLSYLREPRPIDLTLPALLLLLAVGLALLATLSALRPALRLGLIGTLAALAVALATVIDLARLLFGAHPDVFSPLPRLALVGLTLLAVGLLVDTVRRSVAETGLPLDWLPPAVVLFLVTFAVGLWISVRAIETGRAPAPLELPLSATLLVGGVVLATLAGLAVFFAQDSLRRLLDETRHLRASEKRFRDLAAIRARAALEESEARYRDLFDNIPVGVLQTTLDGEILLVNPALVEMMGYETPQEVLSLDLLEDVYADPADRGELLEVLERDGELRGWEVRFCRRDGRIIVVEADVRLVSDSSRLARRGLSEPTIEGTLVDVTERRELEQRLAQAQKMEAIGQLAGGVAHDFNNLLTAIGGYAELARESLTPGSRAAGELDQIRRAAERASRLTRQLLAFSRRQVLEPEIVDLAELVADIENLLRRTLGEQVVLETRLDPDLGAVRMDPTQLEQVLLNLAVNARDAMPRGGRLEISAENVDAVAGELELRTGEGSGRGQAWITAETVGERSWVLLRVRDEGEGMDPETRRRAIDPFFTTKSEGHGTGLGLSTVYGIVQQSGGILEIASTPGEGTEVGIYLERVVPETARAAEEPRATAEPAPAGGRETILLVEDDPQVRDLVTEVLSAGGYLVQTAEDATEALRLCRNGCDPDLLLTDVVMPGISGPDLVAELRRLEVDCRVLFMSGYTSDQIRRDHSLEDEAHYLSKPFTPATLLGKIEEILRRP